MRVTRQQNRFLIQPKVNNLKGQSSLNEIIQAIKKNKYHFAEIIVDLNVFNPRYKNLLHQFFERIVQLKKDNVSIHIIWYIGDNEEVIEAGLNFQSAFDIRFDLQQKNEKKVLLVDPDPFIREFMILSMMHKNIYIDYAENGKEAFDYLERYN
ncbi:MAG TPA: response regulator, partial [Roseivirga sp.]